jgi:hypothetical protein
MPMEARSRVGDTMTEQANQPDNKEKRLKLLAEYTEFIVGLAIIGLVMTGYYIGKLEKGQQ